MSCLIQISGNNGHWQGVHPYWTVALAEELLETLPGAEMSPQQGWGSDPTSGVRVVHHASGRSIYIVYYPHIYWERFFPERLKNPPSNIVAAFIGQYNHHPHCAQPPNRPGWYMPEWPTLPLGYRAQVQEARVSDDLDRRLYWSGTIRNPTGGIFFPPREAGIVLEKRWPDDVVIHDGRLHRAEWFLRAAGHRLNLSLAGAGWCLRDVEMLALGIPYLSVDYRHYGVDAYGGMPVPNVDYVAVDFPCALKYRGRTRLPWSAIPQHVEMYAEALHRRYLEVIDDTAFLDTIATNAMAWYDQHLAPAAVAGQITDEVLRIFGGGGMTTPLRRPGTWRSSKPMPQAPPLRGPTSMI